MFDLPNLEEGYRPAAVCKRGHVASDDLTAEPDAATPRCPRCGAEVLVGCGECGHRIRGAEHRRAYVGMYSPPEFCDGCGAPHPWVSRAGRIYQLQNILDELRLDEAARLSTHEQLEALSAQDLSEEEQIERWREVMRLAPTLADSGRKIVETIVSATLRSQLGI